MTEPKTVKLSTLFDGTNYLDATFEAFVAKWTDSNMPSGPMGLLDTDSEIALERWEIEADLTHTAKKISWECWECPDCGSLYETEDEDECCYDDDDEPIPFTQTGKGTGWVIFNDNTHEYIDGGTGYAWRDVSPVQDEETDYDGTTGVYVWHDAAEAQEAAEWCDEAYNNENGWENRYGHPWANNWWYLPESFIDDDLLKKSGFVVAYYTGGNGRDGATYRLCGIDGGGYSFSRHFVRVVVGMFEENRWTLPTEQGSVLVTADERDELVILGDALSDEPEDQAHA